MRSPISTGTAPTTERPPRPGGGALWPLRGRLRTFALFLYYLMIILALLLIYGHGDFSTPEFIYQGF